jgi:hypothetical protein
MYALLIKYFTVAGLSAFKFVLGIVTGISTGLSWYETAAFTLLGMMVSVLVVSFGGEKVHNLFVNRNSRRLFTKRNRLTVRVWRKYGIWGVAILTPILFTPIGGTLIAVSFGERPSVIIPKMLVSGIAWGIVFAVAVDLLKDQLGSFLK